MKKKPWRLLILLTISLMLSGCGDDDNSTEGGGTDTSSDGQVHEDDTDSGSDVGVDTVDLNPDTEPVDTGEEIVYLDHTPMTTCDGGALDPDTNLCWENPTNVGVTDYKLTLADAHTYCDNLELGGATDWRVPSLLEMRSLVRRSATNGCFQLEYSTEWTDIPAGYCTLSDTCTHSDDCWVDACNPAYSVMGGLCSGYGCVDELITGDENTDLCAFWTSTNIEDRPVEGWVIDIHDCYISRRNLDSVEGVKCVRSITI